MTITQAIIFTKQKRPKFYPVLKVYIVKGHFVEVLNVHEEENTYIETKYSVTKMDAPSVIVMIFRVK
jgi:hypothetical protein